MTVLQHIVSLGDYASTYVADNGPSGSGFNNGTELIRANRKRIVFATAFHHMNDNGFYDGWTHHKVIVDADLYFGYTIKVTGRDKHGIKEYIGEHFTHWLDSNIKKGKYHA